MSISFVKLQNLKPQFWIHTNSKSGFRSFTFIFGFVAAIANFVNGIEGAIAETPNPYIKAGISNPYVIRAKQSEAISYVKAMVKFQQAYFLEQNTWGKNLEELQSGIKSESDNYLYSIKIDTAINTVESKPNIGIAIHMGISKKPELNSYVGFTFLSSGLHSNEITPLRSVCESIKPTMKPPSLPKWDKKMLTCPEGYKKIRS